MKNFDELKNDDDKLKLIRKWMRHYQVILIALAEILCYKLSILGKTAEDFVMDVFLTLYGKDLTYLEDIRNPKSFLKTMLRNHIKNGITRKNRDVDKREDLRVRIRDNQVLNNGEYILFEQDINRLLKNNLTHEQYEAIGLIADGYSYEDGASEVGVSTQTFGSRVYQARRKSKDVLKKNGIASPFSKRSNKDTKITKPNE